MSLIRKIFIFTLLLFPLGEIIRIDFGNGLTIRPLDIGMGILFFSWIILKLFKRQKIVQSNIFLPVILFALAGLFSLIISNLTLSLSEWFISFAYLLRWIIYVSILFIINDFNKEFKKKILNILIAIGTIIVGLGYIQYFYYSALQNLRYLGWDEHMHRMFSVFLDPNFAGVFFVLFFIFLVSLFLKQKKKIIGFLSILTLGAVFLTFSRSALIMLIVSSSVMFILAGRKKLILLLLIIILIMVSISSRYFNIANINLFRVVSSEARIETARNAIKIIQDRPIFGIGFNAYRYAQFHYGFRNRVNIASHADASPDNSFLFVASTSGLIGLILFAFLWFRIFKYYIKNNALVLSSVVGIFVSSLFINSLFYVHIMFWLWIIIGLNSSVSQKSKESR